MRSQFNLFIGFALVITSPMWWVNDMMEEASVWMLCLDTLGILWGCYMLSSEFSKPPKAEALPTFPAERL